MIVKHKPKSRMNLQQKKNSKSSAKHNVSDEVLASPQVLKERMTASELMKLPMEERNARLREQAKKAEWIYKNDPDLQFPDNQDILEY